MKDNGKICKHIVIIFTSVLILAVIACIIVGLCFIKTNFVCICLFIIACVTVICSTIIAVKWLSVRENIYIAEIHLKDSGELKNECDEIFSKPKFRIVNKVNINVKRK